MSVYSIVIRNSLAQGPKTKRTNYANALGSFGRTCGMIRVST
ncbi:hypothetical protein DSTSK_10730 [Desulforhabdus sp. TSK]|nr:hypothetical protein DSTSK_10730 [Desulforhabdus sp. TSK]